MRILYIEDDPRDADITVRILRKTAPHMHLETVSTIHEALTRLERLVSDPLDLVLVDVHLRDGDGLSLLQHIRESSLPLAVVLVTGMGDEETAVAALKARADDYIVKRKDYLDLLPTTLESALNHYRADAARRAHPLNVLYAEDELPDIENTRRHFAVHAHHLHLDVVSTGPEALLALQPKDGNPSYDVLLMNCHLPELNALGVLRELRLTQRHDLPVVLVCREADEELARQGLKLGASSYLVKSPGYLHQLPWELEEAHSRADLRRREAALQASENRLRRAQQAARVGTWEWDVRTGASVWSEMIWELLGLEPDDGATTVERFIEFIHSEDRDRVLRKVNEVIAKGEEYYDEFRLVWRDGVVLWVSSKGRLIRSADGQPERMIGVNIDITERRLAEGALRESEGRLRLAQQAARVGTWEWDVPMGQALWSEMMWELLGLEPRDGSIMTLERFIEHIHPEDRDRALRTVNEVIAEGEEYYDEFRLFRRDGSVLWISSKGRLIRSASGRPERMIGVNIDITERKKAEESLRKALAEVQQLKDQLHEENIYLQEEIRVASNFDEITGQSEALRRVLHQAEQVAPVDTTVLILGETGTGKELLAHAIHNLSPRRTRPLVKVNCAALPPTLIESELFGHEKGAFTGAVARRPGRFKIANGGTLFLDEVGEVPLDLQAKLLRVLEQGEFEPVGSNDTVSVDVRVITATNRNLAGAVHEGKFRSDLYYRLSIFPITLPPLRERREDIPMLVKHLVKQISLKLGKKIETIPQEAMTVLKNYPWPGNVRELRNVIERAVIITEGTKLRLSDSLESLTLEAEFQQPDIQLDSQRVQRSEGETLEQCEYNLILRTLKKVHWRVEGPSGAADLLKICPSTLRSRMKKLGITRPKVQAAFH